MIPSAGQGIIALQCREDDEEIISVLKKINHNETFMRAHVERNILKVLEGDCETAVGAHSILKGKKMFFASHPSVYTLPGTWESQSDIMYDPTLLVVSASVVFATAAIVSVLAIKKKRRKV